VWVNVPVPKELKQARSLDAAYSPAFVDYYEIYLRQRTDDGAGGFNAPANTDKVYFGRAFEGQVLRVAVPPGKNYDALLLAGIEQYKVLLASAFTNIPLANDTTDGTVDGYFATGPGIPIIPGVANTIPLTLSSGYIGSDPATDYTFADNTPATYAVTLNGPGDYNGLYTATLPAKGALTSITADIKTTNLAPLIDADDGAGTAPVFLSHVLSLRQYGTNHPVQTLLVNDGNTTPPTVTGSSPDVTVTYVFNLSGQHAAWPNPDTAATDVRDRGVYARLDYTLEYKAFGRGTTDTMVTSIWKIKNSYDPRRLDKGPNTGASSLLLIIGNDPGDFVPDETVEINYN
jgi:hypothetical protein